MTYVDFDKNIINEFVVLSHLQDLNGKIEKESHKFYEYSQTKLKKENLKKFIKIEKKKFEELEKRVLTHKLKVCFSNSIKKIENGKTYIIFENNLKIYENKFFKKLFNIQLEKEYIIKDVLELDNHDLIFLCRAKKEGIDYNKFYEIYDIIGIIIYIFKNENYLFLQKIVPNNKCYDLESLPRFEISDLISYVIEEDSPCIYSIEKLSGNRFVIITDFGIEVYALNENNEYSVSFKETHAEIKKIYEFNENKFIIFTKRIYYEGSEIYEKYTKPKNMELSTNNSKRKRCCSLRNKGKILLLKIFISNEFLLEYCDNRTNDYYKLPDFIDFIVLKNRYFIFIFNNNLLILDLLNKKILKRYTILCCFGEELFCYNDIKIKKWNDINDNEFILIIKGNITLFELNDSSLKIELKILAYSYFPHIYDIIKVDENNKFCLIKKNNIYFY